MPTVTLLTRVYSGFQLKHVEDSLNYMLKGLKVDMEIVGAAPRGWVQIAVSGEDERAALRHLTEEIGLCPTRLENLERFSTIKGCLINLNESQSELYVDIGVSSPNIVDAAIPLNHLQAQLVDGRKVALRKIIALFGFCEHLPLNVKILNINTEKTRIEATLSEKQITQYKNWTKSLLDRLMILGAPLYRIKSAFKIAECNRDVVSIEPLGLLEHVVTCKLGTDAAGLVPKIGKNLRKATFSIYNPRKILDFLGDYQIS